jgi:valyl-tRNA synthetase
VVTKATDCFEKFDYAGALHRSEDAFWAFCDHYLELVKSRSYREEDSPGRRSAWATLDVALNTFLRLLAPFMPYVTEEVWSWRMAASSGQESVHTAPWPSVEEFAGIDTSHGPEVFEAAVEVVSKIRGAKSAAQKSLKWPVATIEVVSDSAGLSNFLPVTGDVMKAGCVVEGGLSTGEGAPPEKERFDVRITLAAEPEA